MFWMPILRACRGYATGERKAREKVGWRPSS
jgi:hypothetical protein